LFAVCCSLLAFASVWSKCQIFSPAASFRKHVFNCMHPLTSNPPSASSFNNTAVIVHVISCRSSTTQGNACYIWFVQAITKINLAPLFNVFGRLYFNYAWHRVSTLLVSKLDSSNIVNTFVTSKSNAQFRSRGVSVFARQYLITFSLCQIEPSHLVARCF